MFVKFNNTYKKLPERFYQLVNPTPVANPKLIKFNYSLAEELGISKIEAGVKPEGKADRVRQASESNQGLVAMAGDGTNDAPALASADLGISLGSGTDAAKEAAAVVVLKGDLAGIARAFLLGRATR